MLTVDFETFTVEPGMRLLDVGCGQGRHSYEAFRRGAHVTAFDMNAADLAEVDTMLRAMELENQQGQGATAEVVEGDARRMPFADGAFDRVIASEILEHIPEDEQVMAEIVRVTRPGGLVAVTVPRNWPEQVCWRLSSARHGAEYQNSPGGHIRIYQGSELVDKLTRAGLQPLRTHHAHALHAPYWWLKCAVGTDTENAATRAYHRLLVWDMMSAPALTRTAERLLDPVAGKSFVVYLRKPEAP